MPADRAERRSPLGLGPLETAIMRVMWETDGWLTVRDLRSRTDYARAGYTTVAKVASILHEKGLLIRRLGIVARRRQQAKRAAENGGQPPPRTRRTGKRPADLGICDAELARRYDEGQSIRQLAASLGSSYSVVQRRLQATGAQLRPVGKPAKRG